MYDKRVNIVVAIVVAITFVQSVVSPIVNKVKPVSTTLVSKK